MNKEAVCVFVCVCVCVHFEEMLRGVQPVAGLKVETAWLVTERQKSVEVELMVTAVYKCVNLWV